MDRHEPQLAGPAVREAVRDVRRADDDMTLGNHDGLIAEQEGRLAGLDDEDLGGTGGGGPRAHA